MHHAFTCACGIEWWHSSLRAVIVGKRDTRTKPDAPACTCLYRAASSTLIKINMLVLRAAAVLLVLITPAVAAVTQPTSPPALQVYGFSVSDQPTYLHYSWTLPLTVAWRQDKNLCKHAHRLGGRVHLKDGSVLDALSSHASRAAWVQAKVAMARTQGMDGLNFDLEQPINSSTAAAYTALVQEATKAFHTALPGSQVVVDVPWSPWDIDGRVYDWAGLAAAADLLLIMAYDTQSGIPGRCIASANSPIDLVHRSVRQWLSIGVPPNKLLLGLPWYGYDYKCLPEPGGKEVSPATDMCRIAPVPFGDFSCSDAAGSQIGYADIMKVLHPAAPRNTTPIRWEATQQAPYFNYRADGGQVHQVWFDNPRSLRLRYSLVRQYGLAGVGIWHLDALDYFSTDPLVQAQTQDMWGTLEDSLLLQSRLQPQL